MKELTKVIFKNAYRRDNVNKDITAKILSAFVFGTISSLMAFASYRLTNQLIEVDQAPAFINIILLIMIVFLFSRSVFESLNNLYFSKDLKIFLRMPIKPLQLVKSKIKHDCFRIFNGTNVISLTNNCIWNNNERKLYILYLFSDNIVTVTNNTNCADFTNYSNNYEIYKCNKK